MSIKDLLKLFFGTLAPRSTVGPHFRHSCGVSRSERFTPTSKMASGLDGQNSSPDIKLLGGTRQGEVKVSSGPQAIMRVCLDYFTQRRVWKHFSSDVLL
ncbi:hypothetical protein RRG08_063248 [Elysia crispata]|uniref:Uncharacterized protein n=1 Tax=Elysia crispata TaxID=231223 RepID=A0AAE0Y0T3_9GAST|nr:hypothetical protein RRG08_063248 [Elysia crispata]